MATRKQFQQKTEPAHLEGLATWIREENEEPPVCRVCDSNEYVVHRWGEWVCSRCDRVVDA